MTIAYLTVGFATLVVLLARSVVLTIAAQRAQLRRDLALFDLNAAKPAVDLAAAVEQLASAAATLQRAAPRAAPSLIGRRVTVHTVKPDDYTMIGVVAGDYTDRVILRDSEFVTAIGANHPMPGRQDIARDVIAWIDDHGTVTVPDAAPTAPPAPPPTAGIALPETRGD